MKKTLIKGTAIALCMACLLACSSCVKTNTQPKKATTTPTSTVNSEEKAFYSQMYASLAKEGLGEVNTACTQTFKCKTADFTLKIPNYIKKDEFEYKTKDGKQDFITTRFTLNENCKNLYMFVSEYKGTEKLPLRTLFLEESYENYANYIGAYLMGATLHHYYPEFEVEYPDEARFFPSYTPEGQPRFSLTSIYKISDYAFADIGPQKGKSYIYSKGYVYSSIGGKDNYVQYWFVDLSKNRVYDSDIIKMLNPDGIPTTVN